MASPGHRANILNGGWRWIGVGAVHVHQPRGYYRAWDDVTIVAAEFGAALTLAGQAASPRRRAKLAR